MDFLASVELSVCCLSDFASLLLEDTFFGLGSLELADGLLAELVVVVEAAAVPVPVLVKGFLTDAGEGDLSSREDSDDDVLVVVDAWLGSVDDWDDRVDDENFSLADGTEWSGLNRTDDVFLDSTVSCSALLVFTFVSMLRPNSLPAAASCALTVSGTVANTGVSDSLINSCDPLRNALSLDISVKAPPLSDASAAETVCLPVSHGESSFSLFAEMKREGRASVSLSSEPDVEVMLAM